MRVSQLVVDFPEIAELEVNPLFADAYGVLAGDAWLRLRDPGDRGGGLAITPYPVELVEHWKARDGDRLTIRPIRPEDAEQHGAFFSRLSPQDIRYRFFTAMRELSAEQMARLTQVDYDREMAFIAVREATGETVGVARLVGESGEPQGEFAVIVQADTKGKGLATHLMRRLIDWARGHGMQTIVGQVLADNAPMLAFVRHLGIFADAHAGGARRGGGAAESSVTSTALAARPSFSRRRESGTPQRCRDPWILAVASMTGGGRRVRVTQWKRPPSASPARSCARRDATRSSTC